MAQPGPWPKSGRPLPAGLDSRAKVKVDGAYVDADKKIRQGLVRDTNGTLQLVVWMELTSEQPVKISFEKE